VETGAAGGPYEISITAGNRITLKDILLGEVWICSGQSNMEWRLASAQSAKVEIPASNYPEIRLFTVEKHMAAKPRNKVEGSWQVCQPESAGNFSAVGYFFGKNIHQELGVPVGLINTSWGGTPSEAWTSKATLKGLKDFDSELEELCSGSSSDLDLAQKEMDSVQKVIKKQQDFYNPGNIGFSEGWMKPRFKDQEWDRIPVPSEWSKIPAMGQTEGVVWMRTHFVIPEEWLGKTLILELGPVDEMDVTYLNGRKIGASLNMDNWNKNRVYRILGPQVTQVVFTLAIRIVNTHGEGGLFGTPDQLKIYPEAQESMESVDTVLIAGNWKYKVAYEFEKLPPLADPHTPTVLYNGMLHPLKNYAIKGAIWYQGESNVGRAMQYRELFPALISDWRSTWKREEFPFYYVQLAPYKYGTEYTLAELREAQMLTLARTRNTGMAVTMDIGNPDDIHPTNKRDVGRRLSLWALAKDYGREVVYSGPLYKKYQVEGERIRIFFDHTGSGLKSGSGPLTHFEIAGADQLYVPAIAEIDGETVLVSSPGISAPVAVRYGWTNTSEPNLFNLEGLPASSFCTDNWARVTQGRK
jgi:sialate O-acetylesterase